MERKYLFFAKAGAVAGTLQQPFFNGSLKLPVALNFIAPGAIFAVSMTIVGLFTERERGSKPSTKGYAIGSLVLIGGMPLAVFAGALCLNVIDRVVPGDKYQFGGLGLPFFLAEIVSCVVWSAVLCARMLLAKPAKPFWIMRAALFSTTAIMVGANLIEIISKTLWQKTFFLPTISVTEEIGSALILATGCSGYFGEAQKPVTEI